ncbi:MAG: hypothetical protein ACTSVY_00275 [Candidatus Helarchaeota archaeon]
MTVSEDKNIYLDFSSIKDGLKKLADSLKEIDAEPVESKLFKNLARAANLNKEEF